MATEVTTVGIKKSWSLISFAKIHGRMKVAPFVNTKTTEHFKSCVFIDTEGEITLVAFSSNLGELTPIQIAAQKNDLQVVELKTGKYKLCRVGHNTWEDVDLDL